jgi:hypothetical protein
MNPPMYIFNIIKSLYTVQNEHFKIASFYIIFDNP